METKTIRLISKATLKLMKANLGERADEAFRDKNLMRTLIERLEFNKRMVSKNYSEFHYTAVRYGRAIDELNNVPDRYLAMISDTY